MSPEEVKKATEAVNEQIKALDKSKSFAEEFGLTMTSAFEDAIVKGKGLRDILSGIGEDIARIVVRKSITEPLGTAISGIDFKKAGSQAWDWVSSFFADGGIMTSAGRVPLRKYSGGGIANSPQAAIFAEGGVPEAFVPVPSGKIPVELRGGSRISVQIINNTPAQVTTRQTSDGDLEVLIDALDAALGDRVSAGVGAISGAMQGRYGLRPSMGV